MAIMQGIDHNQVITYVMDKWTELKRARLPKQTVWLDCLRAYMRYHDDQKWVAAAKKAGFSHRFFAATWDAVEVLTSTIGQSVWKYPDWMSLEPAAHHTDGVDYDDKAAEQLAKALEYYFRLDGGQRKAKQAIKWMVLTGNCPFTVGWKREPITDYPAYMKAMQQFQAQNEADWARFQQEVMQWQMIAQQAAQLGEPPPPKPQFNTPMPPVVQTQTAYEGPTLTIDDLFNFVIDDPGVVERPMRIKRVIKPLSWLKKYSQRQNDGYILYENLERVTEGELPPESGGESDERSMRSEIFGMDAQPKKGVELHEVQGDMIFPMGSQSGDSIFMNWIGTVANANTLVRFEPCYLWSPRCPTSLAKLIDVPHHAYGMGLIEAAVPIQDLLNRRMNQIVDAVSVAIYPEYKVWDDGVYDPGTASGPGKKHVVGDPNNLQPLIKDARNLGVAMADVQMLLRWFQQITRSTNPYTETASESTATEVERNEMLKSVSFNDLVEGVESSLIAPLMDLFIDHMAMYSSEAVMALITQDGRRKWTQVSPEVIRRGWLTKPRGSKRAADQQRRVQNVLMFIELVTGNPVLMQIALQLGTVDVMALLKMVYKEFDLGGEEKIFRDVEPAEIQAMMLAQLVAGGKQDEDSGQVPGQDAGLPGAAGAGGAIPGPGQGMGLADEIATQGVDHFFAGRP